MKTAMDSPALLVRNAKYYPAHFEGRVPKVVRLTKRVRKQIPLQGFHMEAGEVFDAYVNSQGAVTAIRGDGEMMGLMPDEFEVIEWHDWPLFITQEWLRAVGFRWHQFDRQPGKQWLLWLDCALVQPQGPHPFGEDLGIELTLGLDRSGRRMSRASRWTRRRIRGGSAGCVRTRRGVIRAFSTSVICAGSMSWWRWWKG